MGALLPRLVAALPDRRPAEGAAAPVPYRQVAGTPGAVPVLAATTALVWALLGVARGGRADLAAFLTVGTLGVALAFVDLRVRRLPDVLTGAMLVGAGLLLGVAALAEGHLGDYARSWAGAAALFASFLALALLRPTDLGLGDVKLAAPVGLALAWLGWGHLLLGAFLGFLAGGLAGAAIMLTGRGSRRSSLPFGPSMLLGALVAVVWGRPLLDAYLGR